MGALEDAKARGVNPERKPGVKPLRQICDQTDTLPARHGVDYKCPITIIRFFGIADYDYTEYENNDYDYSGILRS